MKIIFAWDTTSHGGYHARRLSPPNPRATLPDLRAAAKRPYASPHRAPTWRRSIDDQPGVVPQQWWARLSLQAGGRESIAPASPGIGRAAQDDAGGGGGDRGEVDPGAVEPGTD